MRYPNGGNAGAEHQQDDANNGNCPTETPCTCCWFLFGPASVQLPHHEMCGYSQRQQDDNAVDNSFRWNFYWRQLAVKENRPSE
jgi:hypothetical protein